MTRNDEGSTVGAAEPSARTPEESPGAYTPDLTPEQAAKLAEFEAAPPAPESFDATAALRRVVALADFHTECCEYVKVRDLRAAVAGPSC